MTEEEYAVVVREEQFQHGLASPTFLSFLFTSRFPLFSRSAVAAAGAAVLMALVWLGVFLFFLYKTKRDGEPKVSRMEKGKVENEPVKEVEKKPEKLVEDTKNLFELQIPQSPGKFTKPEEPKKVSRWNNPKHDAESPPLHRRRNLPLFHQRKPTRSQSR